MLSFLKYLLATIVGFFISLFLIFFLLVGIAAAFGSEEDAKVESNSILHLKFKNGIPDRESKSPFAEIGFLGAKNNKYSLENLTDEIRYAATDDKIKGIYMEFDLMTEGLATMEELRNAIHDFKKSGKFVYSYAEIYTPRAYYLAAAGTKIFLNPNGALSFSGFSSEQMFVKGLLAKLDITPNLIRAGKYKSAGEMFINDSNSKENREQIGALLNSTFNYYINGIAADRRIDKEELYDIAVNYRAKMPAQALQFKLVDALYYDDQVREELRKASDAKDADKLKLVDLNDYARKSHTTKYSSRGGIALIYAIGNISGGEGDESNIGSEKMRAAIHKAANDSTVKAIVLRVNSPGGSALASDVIWREVDLAKRKKPVIASFGNVAASGGYYIAAPASVIFAEPNTVTGSIGVFGLIPNLTYFWKNKLGITWDRVKIGKHADLGNPNRPMTKEEHDIIQSYIDTTYEQFKSRVAVGRGMSMEDVQALAQGRVYSGEQALNLKLVDKLGGLDEAIAEAKRQAKLGDDAKIRVLPQYDNSFSAMMKKYGQVKAEVIMREQMGAQFDLWQRALQLQQMQGVLMYFPYEIK